MTLAFALMGQDGVTGDYQWEVAMDRMEGSWSALPVALLDFGLPGHPSCTHYSPLRVLSARWMSLSRLVGPPLVCTMG